MPFLAGAGSLRQGLEVFIDGKEAASFVHFKPVVCSEPPARSRSTLALWQACVLALYK